MLKQITDQQYFPTLSMRPSEMKALEELPEETKDILLPLVLISPWAASKQFQNSAERLYKAYGNRPILLDLDRSYRSNSDREAIRMFQEMKDEGGGYKKWINYIENHESFIPVVQTAKAEVEEIIEQSSNLAGLNRGRAYRLDLGINPAISKLKACIQREENRDFILIVDGGWSANAEFVAAQIVAAISKLADDITDIRTVIVSSSFPNDFTDIEGLDSLPIGARQVFELVRARFNQLRLYYGDWASAKPRNYDGFGSTPRPRIDFVTKRRWILSRNEKDDVSYEKAAKRITAIPEWEQRPKIWSSYMIEKTAKGSVGGIKAYQQAIAARINMHLYVQSHYAADIPTLVTDEPWADI